MAEIISGRQERPQGTGMATAATSMWAERPSGRVPAGRKKLMSRLAATFVLGVLATAFVNCGAPKSAPPGPPKTSAAPPDDSFAPPPPEPDAPAPKPKRRAYSRRPASADPPAAEDTLQRELKKLSAGNFVYDVPGQMTE